MQCLICCILPSSYFLVLLRIILILQLFQLWDWRVCWNELPQTLALPYSKEVASWLKFYFLSLRLSLRGDWLATCVMFVWWISWFLLFLLLYKKLQHLYIFIFLYSGIRTSAKRCTLLRSLRDKLWWKYISFEFHQSFHYILIIKFSFSFHYHLHYAAVKTCRIHCTTTWTTLP